MLFYGGGNRCNRAGTYVKNIRNQHLGRVGQPYGTAVAHRIEGKPGKTSCMQTGKYKHTVLPYAIGHVGKRSAPKSKKNLTVATPAKKHTTAKAKAQKK
jgi:hypothetical protein